MKFQDKVAIITGAGSGIGQGTALALAAEGCKVCILDITRPGLEETSQMLQKAGVKKEKILLIAGDLTETDYCKMAVASTMGYFKKIDILVNSAGILHRQPAGSKFEDIPLESYDHLFNANLRAMFHMCQLVMPYLEVTKGNIVNISSVCAKLQVCEQLVYCLTKAGVEKLTSIVAVDVAKRGIRVNSVNPGAVKTNMLTNTGTVEEVEQRYVDMVADHPIGRLGTAEDMANAVIYLASDAASFVTGHNLYVDGGCTKK